MGAIVMVAANDGINHEAGYGHEHEKKKGSERHYIPLPPAYEIRRGRLDGRAFIVRDVSWTGMKCPNCGLAAKDWNRNGHMARNSHVDRDDMMDT